VDGEGNIFPRLFDGRETASCVKLREGLYERAWGVLDERIQVCLPILSLPLAVGDPGVLSTSWDVQMGRAEQLARTDERLGCPS